MSTNYIAAPSRKLSAVIPGLGLLRARGLDQVAIDVACAHHVDIAQLLGRNRCKSVAAARAELCVRLRGYGLSLPEIGLLVDRDHTTVLAAIRSRRLRIESCAEEA